MRAITRGMGFESGLKSYSFKSKGVVKDQYLSPKLVDFPEPKHSGTNIAAFVPLTPFDALIFSHISNSLFTFNIMQSGKSQFVGMLDCLVGFTT